MTRKVSHIQEEIWKGLWTPPCRAKRILVACTSQGSKALNGCVVDLMIPQGGKVESFQPKIIKISLQTKDLLDTFFNWCTNLFLCSKR